MKRKMAAVMAFFAAGVMVSCSAQRIPADITAQENEQFMAGAPSSPDEVFKVLLSSEAYTVKQISSPETIMRDTDPAGDQYMREELGKCDKINEVREAVYTVSLYPDTGRVYQIRPKKLSNLIEVDNLIVQDLQRWSIANPDKKKKEVSPLKFEVHYRVVLKKKMSDEAILQEKRDAMKERSGQ
ncbi:MAG: hypothetical protein ACRCUT_05295 [Spirochaetota bacterium]